MNKTQLELAAQWCDEKAMLASNTLLSAAYKTVAFNMREEAARGFFIEPLPDDYTLWGVSPLSHVAKWQDFFDAIERARW